MEVIDRFEGEYQFLSNFYPAVVKLGALYYPTVEHAYQAAKTLIPAEKIAVLDQWGPGGAKKLGQKLTIRPNWERVKFGFMFDLVRQKFSKHPELEQKLLDTGTAHLIEGNGWHDTYWGVCSCGIHHPVPQYNHLGQILMVIRSDLYKNLN
jgi:ribA/ribD-fused uncharacterized protein